VGEEEVIKVRFGRDAEGRATIEEEDGTVFWVCTTGSRSTASGYYWDEPTPKWNRWCSCDDAETEEVAIQHLKDAPDNIATGHKKEGTAVVFLNDVPPPVKPCAGYKLGPWEASDTVWRRYFHYTNEEGKECRDYRASIHAGGSISAEVWKSPVFGATAMRITILNEPFSSLDEVKAACDKEMLELGYELEGEVFYKVGGEEEMGKEGRGKVGEWVHSSGCWNRKSCAESRWKDQAYAYERGSAYVYWDEDGVKEKKTLPLCSTAEEAKAACDAELIRLGFEVPNPVILEEKKEEKEMGYVGEASWTETGQLMSKSSTWAYTSAPVNGEVNGELYKVEGAVYTRPSNNLSSVKGRTVEEFRYLAYKKLVEGNNNLTIEGKTLQELIQEYEMGEETVVGTLKNTGTDIGKAAGHGIALATIGTANRAAVEEVLRRAGDSAPAWTKTEAGKKALETAVPAMVVTSIDLSTHFGMAIPKAEIVRDMALIGVEDASRDGFAQLMQEMFAMLMPLFSMYAAAGEVAGLGQEETKQIPEELPDANIESVREREAVVVEGQHLQAVK